MSNRHTITDDPIYFIIVAFFALLTTALPAVLGQPNFLPIVQALALTVFFAIPLSHRNPTAALRVMALWLPIQYGTGTLLTLIAPGAVERAIHDGFVYRGEISAWLYGNGTLPGGLLDDPTGRLLEIAGVVGGGLATAGLVGAWFLMRTVDLAAYGTGTLIRSLEDGALFRVLPYWTLFRAAGLAGLLLVCAEPLLTYNWSPLFYWRTRRRQILISVGLLGLGLLLELILPGLLIYPPAA